jgi:hypothetical protein
MVKILYRKLEAKGEIRMVIGLVGNLGFWWWWRNIEGGGVR